MARMHFGSSSRALKMWRDPTDLFSWNHETNEAEIFLPSLPEHDSNKPQFSKVASRLWETLKTDVFSGKKRDRGEETKTKEIGT